MSHKSIYFALRPLSGHQAKAIKRELDTLPGVTSVSVSQAEGRVAVDYDSTGVQPDAIRRRLEDLGLSANSLE